jgi:P-type Ca2+ transporter type 2C
MGALCCKGSSLLAAPHSQVGAFVSWYMFDHFMGIDLSADGHSTVSWAQLTNWQDCPSWQDFTPANFTTVDGGVVQLKSPCDYFAVRNHLR